MDNRHDEKQANSIMRFFEFKHLKPHMIEVSKPFCELAEKTE